MLFGKSKFTVFLKQVLDLDTENGYDTGRFRDIFVKEEGKKIVLYTRNGGGNRDCYCGDYRPRCDGVHDSGCLAEVIKALQTHPEYITDYDDDGDCTYAYFEFKTPEKYKNLVHLVYSLQGAPQTVTEKFSEVIKEMKTKTASELEADPRFTDACKIVKKIGACVKSEGEGELKK